VDESGSDGGDVRLVGASATADDPQVEAPVKVVVEGRELGDAADTSDSTLRPS